MADSEPTVLDNARKQIKDLEKIHQQDYSHHMRAYLASADEHLKGDDGEHDHTKLNDATIQAKFVDGIINYHAKRASEKLNMEINPNHKDLRIARYSQAILEKDLGVDVNTYKSIIMQQGANYTGQLHMAQHANIQSNEKERAAKAIAANLHQDHLDEIIEKSNVNNILADSNLGKLDKAKLGTKGMQSIAELYLQGAGKDAYQQQLSQYTTNK